MSDFQFGGLPVKYAQRSCCGKPRGCTMTHDECLFLRHPWKRAMVYGDLTVRCQATSIDPETGEQQQCVLLNGHEPGCSNNQSQEA